MPASATRTLSRRGPTTRAVASAALAVLAALTLSACFPPPVPWTITTAAVSVPGSWTIDTPTDVAVDAAGNLYVAASRSRRVMKVDPTGAMTVFAGSPNAIPGSLGYGDGGPAVLARFDDPDDVTVDAAGNVYVSDGGDDRVRKVDTTGTITTVAGTNPGRGFSGDGGPATDARLFSPAGVAVDATGNLYIADQLNDRVRKVDTTGTITTVAGNGTQGYSGDGGPATDAQLARPDDVAVDAAGNLYIADRDNDRVRKVDTTGTITTVAGNGTRGSSGDGGPATDAEIEFPSGLAIHPDGMLAFSEGPGHRVRVVHPNGTIGTAAGTGFNGFGGDGGLAADASFLRPDGLAFDAATRSLYIADSGNDRVRRVWPGGGAIGGRVTAEATGDGVAGLTVNLYEAGDLVDPVETTTTNVFGWYGFSIVTGDYKVEVESGSGFSGEWFDDAADGPSATTVAVDEGDQDRADLALAP